MHIINFSHFSVMTEFILVSFTFTLILSCFETYIGNNFLKSFITIFITHIITDKFNSQLCILTDAFIIALSIVKSGRKFIDALFFSVLSASILTIIIVISGNAEIFILSDLYNYNQNIKILLVSSLVTVLGICLSVLLKKINISINFFENISKIIVVVFELIILFVYYIAIPIIFMIGKENMIAVLILIFFVSAGIGNIILIVLINHLEQKKITEELFNAKKEAFEKEIVEVKKFKHLFASRYQLMSYYIFNENFSELKDYFMDNIEPIAKNYKDEKSVLKKIELIEDDPIKLAVFSIVNKCLNYGINVMLNTMPIKDTKCSKNDLISILGILLDNAFLEAKNMKDSIIKILISQDISATVFQISNTYGDLSKAENNALYKEALVEKRYGKGLLIADDIIKNNNSLTLNTWKSGNEFTQQLIIERKYL